MAYQKIFKKPYNLDVIHNYIEHLSFTDKIRYRLLQKNCNDLEEYVDLVTLTSLAKDSGMTLDEYLLSWNDAYYERERLAEQAAAVKEEQEALRLVSLFSQYQSQHRPQPEIIEKSVEVIKEVPVEIIKEIPVADPKQQAKIDTLEKQVKALQKQQASAIIEPEDTRPVEPIHLIDIPEAKKKEYKKLIKQRKKTMAEIAAENGWNESDLRASL